MRRSYIVSLVATVVLTATAVISAAAAGWAPLLGLDLQGGVAVTYEATEVADDETLDQAVEIIRQRVDALGVAEPDITRQGTTIVVELPGVDDAKRALDLVGQTAELRFRPVLQAASASDPQSRFQMQEFANLLNESLANPQTADEAATEDTATEDNTDEDNTGETGTDETGTDESAETTTTTEDTATEDNTDEAGTDETGTDESAETTTTTEDTATEDNTDEADTDETGTGESAETTTTTPETTTTTEFDPTTAPTIEDLITAPDQDDADAYVVLPSSDGLVLYLLQPALLTGEIVDDANASFNNASWLVLVDFTSEGSDAWDQMAALMFEQQIAIALDGVVESAPTINAREFGGRATITGTFTEQEAEDLALVLRFGALPVELEPQTVQTVSATLGDDALRAGVVAGLIGLALVALYMLFYYRLLGLVAISSLAVSTGILWFLIAWLGETRGLALSLSGAVGIILSIGVAVDSNIVYYERIKEEVHRGRSIRSAADGSFAGAFSTIVKADMASLIGAFILFVLTVGAVRGFALYLGVATVIDMVVSYVFMRPLVVLLARKFAADKPGRLGITTVDSAAVEVTS
ncbi:MAG: protein translocase subunit SecD [Actinomycetia bacterium]|nr:protein translocase subunit SecD [Actinomycetes bacterium]